MKKTTIIFLLLVFAFFSEGQVPDTLTVPDTANTEVVDQALDKVETGINEIIDEGKRVFSNPVDNKNDFSYLWNFFLGIITSLGVYLVRLFPKLDGFVLFRKNIVMVISFALATALTLFYLRGEYTIVQIALDWGIILINSIGLYELLLKRIGALGKTRKPEVKTNI